MNLTYHTALTLCGLILEAFLKSEKKSIFFILRNSLKNTTGVGGKAREDGEERIRICLTSVFSCPAI